MRAMFVTMVLGLVVFVGLSTSNGCGKADEIFDCQSVCSRYHDCFDKNYDVGHCRDQCRTRSENDPSVRAAADKCEACMDDKSCLSAAFNCTVDCGTIIVQ